MNQKTRLIKINIQFMKIYGNMSFEVYIDFVTEIDCKYNSQLLYMKN